MCLILVVPTIFYNENFLVYGIIFVFYEKLLIPWLKLHSLVCLFQSAERLMEATGRICTPIQMDVRKVSLIINMFTFLFQLMLK